MDAIMSRYSVIMGSDGLIGFTGMIGSAGCTGSTGRIGVIGSPGSAGNVSDGAGGVSGATPVSRHWGTVGAIVMISRPRITSWIMYSTTDTPPSDSSS